MPKSFWTLAIAWIFVIVGGVTDSLLFSGLGLGISFVALYIQFRRR